MPLVNRSIAFLLLSNAALAYDSPKDWYTRYESYPPYCSTPDEMATRKIPPLRDDDPHLGETRLVHVTAIIRHGARTPWTRDQECWAGYWESEETGVWDCDLTTILAPPTPNRISQEEKDTSKQLPNNAMFLFEKKYDALHDPDDSLTNELNGNCEVGQLLLQGYEQSLQNGKFLREAYLFDSTSFDHDERMRLLDVSFSGYTPWDEHHLRYRSDDDQRTLMSGQVLLRGLFGPEVIKAFTTNFFPSIPVHTADRDRDILDANPNVCPKLNLVKDTAHQSQTFQRFNDSITARGIRQFMATNLGKKNMGEEVLDCLMTTMCTDRPLPDVLDDYSANGTSWFRTLADFDAQSYNLMMKYNDAEFAKLAMGPLWAEIMDNINPFLDEETEGGLPLVLFSGHDTTIMPLMASLGPKLWKDTDWAPYASMMLIEIHEIIDGRTDRTVFKTPFAFRLIYNGKVLTSLVEGCPENSDLCDARFLQEIASRIARRDLDCVVPSGKSSPVLNEAASLLSTAMGMLLFVALVAVSALVGAVASFLFLTGRLPTTRQLLASSTVTDLDDVGELSLRDEKGFSDEPSGFSDEPSAGSRFRDHPLTDETLIA